MWIQILRPLEKLVAETRELAASTPDPIQKLEIPQDTALRILAESLNQMAVQLTDQAQTARQHERERERERESRSCFWTPSRKGFW